MTNSTATGLMAFWADIDADYEKRFLEWHNCEHMPERVAIPGFREGRRYHGIGDAPAYLMMYLTERPAVLKSDHYMERLNEPTPWTSESLTHFRNPSRNIYGLIAEHGDATPNDAPYLISVRFDMAQGAEDQVRSAIERDVLPGWCALPPVGRARFYGINAAISGIETAERGIYGGGPGAQRYLLLVDCALPGAAESAEWRTIWTDLARAEHGGEAVIAHVIQEAFWIDYVLAAP